jgi:hypothetical protein
MSSNIKQLSEQTGNGFIKSTVYTDGADSMLAAENHSTSQLGYDSYKVECNSRPSTYVYTPTA